MRGYSGGGGLLLIALIIIAGAIGGGWIAYEALDWLLSGTSF